MSNQLDLFCQFEQGDKVNLISHFHFKHYSGLKVFDYATGLKAGESLIFIVQDVNYESEEAMIVEEEGYSEYICPFNNLRIAK